MNELTEEKAEQLKCAELAVLFATAQGLLTPTNARQLIRVANNATRIKKLETPIVSKRIKKAAITGAN